MPRDALWPALWSALRDPVPAETRARLRETWAQLPPRFRTHDQYFGRQYAGCGATIGAMPRCDFACRGCYLGAGANRVPPLPLAELEEQIRVLRRWLGRGGNVQLTDGEVALRDEDELVQLTRFARAEGLSPMLMTHGEGFRREPERLRRLLDEGGLRELSIHIDSTQRGRRDPRYRNAASEAELMPLRDEFAALLRSLRGRGRRRRPLDVASTVTVTRDNLREVSDVVAWFVRNADAFKMLSFQPVASVGRTEASLREPVSVDVLWEGIAEGLGGDAAAHLAARSTFGHPGCSRFLQGAVLRPRRGAPRFVPLLDPADPRDDAFRRRAVEAFGGLTFRLDGRAVAGARLAGLVLHAPRASVSTLRWGWRWLGRAARAVGWSRPRLLANLARRAARIDYLNIVSHHFMSRAELESPVGRERLELCTFRVPVDGVPTSMCEVNATGLRERIYQEAADRAQGGSH